MDGVPKRRRSRDATTMMWIDGREIRFISFLLSTELRQKRERTSASGVNDDGAGFAAVSGAVFGAFIPKALTTP